LNELTPPRQLCYVGFVEGVDFGRLLPQSRVFAANTFTLQEAFREMEAELPGNPDYPPSTEGRESSDDPAQPVRTHDQARQEVGPTPPAEGDR
jgi:hypothetical protein